MTSTAPNPPARSQRVVRAVKRVLVAGASGFVGRRLCPALEEAGHEVVAMTRNPDRYDGAGRAVAGDVHDADSLRAALKGCDVAYYLVHSLASPDFERLDAEAASAFGRAAAEAGVGRIVYLGGLGRTTTSCRRTCAAAARSSAARRGGVPVTTLRAGIVIGHLGLSWEMTRQLVERLPLMVTPRWVCTRTQPIAVDDVVRYLVGVLDVPETEGRAFEVGGDEVLRYSDMMRRVAAVEGRPLVLLPVPLLSPRLSSHWLGLITDVDAKAGSSLVDSMVNEVVVEDDELHRLIPFERSRSTTPSGRRWPSGPRTSGPPGPPGAAAAKLPMSLAHQVPVRRDESTAVVRQRRRVVAATSVVGAGLLGVALSAKPGSRQFYGTTMAGPGLTPSAASRPGRCTWAGSSCRTRPSVGRC